MSDLSIHLITTKANANRQQSILDTWLKNYFNYVFYTDFDSGVGNQIELTTNTKVDSGGEKHILEIQRIMREKLYDINEWFYFCDDDTVLNLNLIFNFIKNAEKNKVYGAIGNTWQEDTSLFYASGGAGYLVHCDIFKNKSYPRLKSITWGDVQFGLWMRENNIIPVHMDEFKWDEPHIFGLNINNIEHKKTIKNYFSFHYIKNNETRKILTDIFEN
jgi:hypothetical protein